MIFTVDDDGLSYVSLSFAGYPFFYSNRIMSSICSFMNPLLSLCPGDSCFVIFFGDWEEKHFRWQEKAITR